MAAGYPGWAGESLVLLDGLGTVRARIWLEGGEVRCSQLGLLQMWTRTGVIGRGDRGTVFPADGQAFLDELPFAYRNVNARAVPERTRAHP